MNKLALLLAVAAVLIDAPCKAGVMPAADHLEPVLSATQAAARDDKSAEVEQILFKEAFGPGVLARARVYVLPGGYEEMAFITETSGVFHLINLYSYQSITWFSMKHIQRKGAPPEEPPNPHKALVVRGEISISPGLAKSITATWKRLLLQTRYETEHGFAHDGIRYTLSMEDDSGAYAGEIWNPYEFPVIGAMAVTVDAMMMYCPYGEPSASKCTLPDARGIAAQLTKLNNALDAQKPCPGAIPPNHECPKSEVFQK